MSYRITVKDGDGETVARLELKDKQSRHYFSELAHKWWDKEFFPYHKITVRKIKEVSRCSQ